MDDFDLNDVMNVLTLFGEREDVKDVLATLLTKNEVSLNNIITMPEDIYHTMSPSQIVSQTRYDDWKKETKGTFVPMDSSPITGEMQTELFMKYGVDNWEDWRVKNWGTVFDAKDTEIINDNQLSFNTSDSTPFVGIIRLSIMFPRVIFKVEYADEDLGVNVGIYRIENGNVLSNDQPKVLSIEAYSMAMDITGDTYYIEEFLHDMVTDEIEEEFPKMLIQLAYDKRKVSRFLPLFILEKFMGLAVDEEDYEFASEVKKLIEEKELINNE